MAFRASVRPSAEFRNNAEANHLGLAGTPASAAENCRICTGPRIRIRAARTALPCGVPRRSKSNPSCAGLRNRILPSHASPESFRSIRPRSDTHWPGTTQLPPPAQDAQRDQVELRVWSVLAHQAKELGDLRSGPHPDRGPPPPLPATAGSGPPPTRWATARVLGVARTDAAGVADALAIVPARGPVIIADLAALRVHRLQRRGSASPRVEAGPARGGGDLLLAAPQRQCCGSSPSSA
jgi:hypothetical protein